MYLLLLPFLFGCVHTKIIDELDLVTIVGIDFIDDKMQITAIYHYYTPDKKVENKRLEMTLNKDEDISDHLDREANRPVMLGDIDVIVIGKTVAGKGMYPVIDTLQRRADMGARLYIVLTEEPVRELLSGNYENKGNGQYISKLIEHNVDYRDIPKTNLHLFASDFFQKGKGAYLPILRKKGEDKLQIIGLGIFDDKKLVHSIPADQMFYFKLLVDQHNKSSINVKIGKNSAIVHDVKTKTSISTDYDTLTVHIDYKLRGVVERYTGKRVDPKTIEKIKKGFEKKVEAECLQLLKDFQERKIDPVGIQRKFMQQNRDFDDKKWKDQYANVTFKIHSKVIITESGTVE
nr:Ger(x)C family spore germination protein [Lederbergia citrea]